MKEIFTLILLAICFQVTGQGTQPLGTAQANLDVSNINATILTGGDAFADLTFPYASNFPHTHGFEVPRGSGKHTIFASGLWIGGKDAGGQPHVASQTYRQKHNSFGYDASFNGLTQAGFWPGPVATNQTAAHNLKYDKVWKVTKAEISHHLTNFKLSGYSIPTDIATWPGNGNISKGEPPQLAPFADRNNDGVYSPNLGDYPLIKGDQALYIILNDNGNTKVPASPAMNAEVHIMYYGFDDKTNEAVFNTVFAEYRIINRSQINFHDFYAGIWTDFDIGFFNDDYVGSDTLNNRYYGYNGDDNDEGPEGYGLIPPLQSVTFLDQKMSSFIYYNNDGNYINGNPWKATEFYNYLRGYWKDNKLVTYGSDGTNQNNRPAKYMFPGDSDTKQGWSEKNVNPNGGLMANVPQDRRGIGSIGPFTLNAGSELKFTVAYTYTRKFPTPEVSYCEFGFFDAQETRKFFAEMKPEPVAPISDNVLLWPNPVQDFFQFHIEGLTGRQTATITITDNVGRTVFEQTLETENGRSLPINLNNLGKGIYMVTITSGNQTLKDKLVKL